MAKKIGKKFGVYLKSYGYIQDDEVDVIRYAFEVLCSEVLEFILIFFIALFLDRLLQSVIYAILFSILRKYLKGYHASTIQTCILLTIGCYLLCILCYQYIHKLYIIFLIFVSVILQIFYGLSKSNLTPLVSTIVLIMIGFIVTIGGCSDFFSIYAILLLLVTIAMFLRKEDYET